MNKGKLFLEGEHVALRPIEPEDMPRITKWINDGTVTYYMFYGQEPRTVAHVSEEFDHYIKSANEAAFLVEDKQTGTPVGFAGLFEIHSTSRKAEFRVLLGEKAFWNRGYGTEVTELLIFYGFDRLNLNRVFLGVTDENRGAVRAYEKTGFKVEGRLRQDIYRNSRYYDSIRMAILRDEYYPDLFARHQQRFAPARPVVPQKETIG